MGRSRCVFFLAYLVTLISECSSFSFMYWSAYVSVTQGNTTLEQCECGLYGEDSPLRGESGVVVLPNEGPLACNITTFNVTHTPWIALIKRGDCNYTKKINAAMKYNASAVVIYNTDNTGNDTNKMSHPGTGDIVVVMIGNEFGTEIVSRLERGQEIFISVTLGHPHSMIWSNPIWVYIMSFTFFAVMAVTLAYFTIMTVKRIHHHVLLRREQRHLKSVAQKAISKLHVRTLKKGDEVVGSDNHTCAVCIEGYKHGEVVMDLTCSHFFHKVCIEPWLLEHRTCPMCKCNILGLKTVDEEVNSGAAPPPLDVSFYPESRPNPFHESFEEVSLSDSDENTPRPPTPSATVTETLHDLLPAAPSQNRSKPDENHVKEHHHYDNLAFEGDSNNINMR